MPSLTLRAGVIPFADCAIQFADEMNSRLGIRHNTPRTSALRRDKFLQQAHMSDLQVLKPTLMKWQVSKKAAVVFFVDPDKAMQGSLKEGWFTSRIANCTLARLGWNAVTMLNQKFFCEVLVLEVKVTADVVAAQKFASTYGQVVVKPRASSGGDGVWLCSEDDDAWLGLCHVPSCHDLSLIASILPHFCNAPSRWVFDAQDKDILTAFQQDYKYLRVCSVRVKCTPCFAICIGVASPSAGAWQETPGAWDQHGAGGGRSTHRPAARMTEKHTHTPWNAWNSFWLTHIYCLQFPAKTWKDFGCA